MTAFVRPKRIESITHAVGNTPLLRPRALEPAGVELYGKLEFANPFRSFKGRGAS